MEARYLVIGVVVLLVFGVLTNPSYAKIDPKTCVGMWLFDDGNGNIAKDSSENKNDGTLMNDPKWVNGKLGKALDFTGVNDYVVIPNGAAVLEQQFSQMSLVAWVYPTAFNGGGSMDEIAIFNIALTDDDIKSIADNGLGKALGIAAVSYAGKLTTTWADIKYNKAIRK